MEGNFSQTFTFASGASVSDAFELGMNNPMVSPISVHSPADLKATVELGLEVSQDGTNWYAIYDRLAADYAAVGLLSLDLVINSVTVLPYAFRVGIFGWRYMRLVSRDGSHAAIVTTGETIYKVYFSDANRGVLGG